jgi:hypothetical protein
MPDEELQPEREPATSHAGLYHRHGEADPEQGEKHEAVTDRPNDTPLDAFTVENSTLAQRAAIRRGDKPPPSPPPSTEGNSTLAERAAERRKERGEKKVDEAENKAVTSAPTKGRRKSS